MNFCYCYGHVTLFVNNVNSVSISGGSDILTLQYVHSGTYVYRDGVCLHPVRNGTAIDICDFGVSLEKGSQFTPCTDFVQLVFKGL